jgi:hypothetical protein
MSEDILLDIPSNHNSSNEDDAVSASRLRFQPPKVPPACIHRRGHDVDTSDRRHCGERLGMLR